MTPEDRLRHVRYQLRFQRTACESRERTDFERGVAVGLGLALLAIEDEQPTTEQERTDYQELTQWAY